MERLFPLADPKNRPYNYGAMGEGPSEDRETFLTGLDAARRSAEKELPQRIEGRANREAHLRSLPKKEFEGGNTTPQWATERILDVALPVDKYQALKLERNVKGREMVLGSWGIRGEGKGVFSIYELLQRQIPEKQLGTIVHEGIHAATSLDPENAFLYGGEERRAQIDNYVRSAAEQALITGEHLNAYHKGLLQQCLAGKISKELFALETEAIMGELAITNRKALEEAQGRTHRALEDKIRAGEIEPQEKVFFMSGYDKKGELQVRGIDVALINLTDGVNDFKDLETHIGKLKAKFYPDSSLKKAQDRGTY